MTITVITPTWQRHDKLLDRCIPSVKNQTVTVNHIIVSDGPDPTLRELLVHEDVTYIEVPEHTTDIPNVGARARNYGLSHIPQDTTFIAYLDDDNAYRPQHIETLYAALTSDAMADFAYSRMFRHGLGDEIGSAPPAYGTIDSSLIMHRHDVHVQFGLWPDPSIYEVDWQLIESWLRKGARWTFVPIVTVDYYFKS